MLYDEYNIPKSKVIVLPNCVEPFKEIPTVNLRDKYKIQPNKQVILFIGRFTKIKGLDILLSAFKILYKEKPNIILLIVGENYDNTIDALDYDYPGIKLFPPTAVQNEFYSIADVVVLPSRLDPFPYVMLESGMMKKPFIGARTGGIAEYIEDRINGLLFEPENESELIEKINYVLNNPEKGQLLAQNLHKKVLENNSCDKYFAELEKIYDEV